ncbi:MAG: HAMP domain-containing sensor histidine kinase [Candidatus Izemoplasmatales bacterium]|nr:HAMP domain-containing sensor histidine kinase [Candidatus Izemoplasmatales bacterium]
MKSTIRSKLFLFTYGIILGFIVALIILNNTFLQSYYINNRESSLIQAFQEIKEIDIDDGNLENKILEIESRYNLSVQILIQTETIPSNIQVDDFVDYPDLYDRLYGSEYTIPSEILSKIIVDYNLSMARNTTLDFGKSVSIDTEHDAYLMDMNSEVYNFHENYQMLGLFVATDSDYGEYMFYVSTITFSSIQDSIRIFNSFTILIGFIFMIIAGLVMYFLSYRFTNPIIEINRVADEISRLDFSHRIDVTTDDEIGDLGYSINKMSVQLEKSITELQLSNDKLAKEILYKNKIDQMRKEFVANASHELKTPLSLIMGYGEALKLSDLDEETKKEYLEIILDETNKMNNLVQELLNLSQIESGKKEFKYKDFSVRSLIEDTSKLFTLVFEKKNINFKLNLVDEIVNSDYDQLQSVLSNYISNAINHIDGNRRITITSIKDDLGNIKVSVKNTGEHIPEAEIKSIWDSFYKIDKARTRAYGGQGLGLSIVKTILETLGYDYGVNNVSDGVEFYFTIDKSEF